MGDKAVTTQPPILQELEVVQVVRKRSAAMPKKAVTTQQVTKDLGKRVPDDHDVAQP